MRICTRMCIRMGIRICIYIYVYVFVISSEFDRWINCMLIERSMANGLTRIFSRSIIAAFDQKEIFYRWIDTIGIDPSPIMPSYGHTQSFLHGIQHWRTGSLLHVMTKTSAVWFLARIRSPELSKTPYIQYILCDTVTETYVIFSFVLLVYFKIWLAPDINLFIVSFQRGWIWHLSKAARTGSSLERSLFASTCSGDKSPLAA